MGAALGWHVVVRLLDDRVLVATPAEALALARSMAELAVDWPVLAWRAADTHLHFLVLGHRRGAGELARRVNLRLGQGVKGGLCCEAARLRPVRDQAHLRNSFWYVLRQAEHHGVGSDPWHVASSLPDLLGLRLLEEASAGRVRAHLPRVTRRGLLGVLGWRDEGLPEAVPLGLISEAGAAALGRGSWRSRVVLGEEVRAAGVQLALRQAGRAEVARGLGLSPTTVRRLAVLPVGGRVRRAVEGQVAWRCEVGAVEVGFAAG